METLIAELVRRFERGALTRRQLIQGLSSLLIASSASPAAAQTAAPTAALKGTRIDHVSVLVTDMARSSAFYQSVFGLAPVSEDKDHKILRLGGPRTIVSLRQEPPAGLRRSSGSATARSEPATGTAISMKKWNTADPQRETWNWIARSPKQSQHKAQPGQGSF